MDDSDFFVIKQYLLRTVTRAAFWKGVAVKTKLSAVESLNQLDNSKEAWQAWMDDWLNEGQYKKLQSTVRKRRQRQNGKDITISGDAHKMLVALSENGKYSLSQVIEARLKRAYENHLKKMSY